MRLFSLTAIATEASQWWPNALTAVAAAAATAVRTGNSVRMGEQVCWTARACSLQSVKLLLCRPNPLTTTSQNELKIPAEGFRSLQGHRLDGATRPSAITGSNDNSSPWDGTRSTHRNAVHYTCRYYVNNTIPRIVKTKQVPNRWVCVIVGWEWPARFISRKIPAGNSNVRGSNKGTWTGSLNWGN